MGHHLPYEYKCLQYMWDQTGIQSVNPVFQVLFAVAVLSAVHSTTFAPVYKVTGEALLLGLTLGYTSSCCQTLSPLINNGGESLH